MMKNKLIVFLVISLLTMMIGTSAVPVLADGLDAIVITTDSDFITYAESGSGIAADPYVINSVYMESNGGYGIYIENTDAYCIINDFTIFGDSPGYGVYLMNVANVNFTNGQIINQRNGMLIMSSTNVMIDNVDFLGVDEDYGIRIDDSDNIWINFCYFEGNHDGVQLWDSFRILISDNQFIGTGMSFYGTTQISTGVVVRDNTVNGLPLGYLYNAHDMELNVSGYGQAILVSCTNVSLYDAVITDTNIGIEFIFTQNCKIYNSDISSCYYGILIYESYYSEVYWNEISDNLIGVYGDFAVGTSVYENNIYDNYIGLWAYYGCSSALVYANNFIGNDINARDDGGREDSRLIWAAIRFTNSKSGWPLSNVSITIQQYARSYTGYSNELGIFKVPLPNLGPYNITIEKFRYQTINIQNYENVQKGINVYDIALEKDNLGPGTGYVQARFMDGVIPISGVPVDVYSYLDGAYYFHSSYVSASGGYAGWVNIIGLYYDDYIFVADHPYYERKIIQQVVISDGLVGTYNNVQLTPHPTDAFVYGYVRDIVSNVVLENVNVTISNEMSEVWTLFTDINGFFNFTGLPFGFYLGEANLVGYEMIYSEFIIDDIGNQLFNPVLIEMIPEGYVPEDASDAIVNDYDNGVFGNYWDDFSGDFVLAESGVYNVPGDNMENPVDEFPLSEPYIRDIPNPIPTTSITTTIPPTGIIDGPSIDFPLLMFTSIMCISCLVLFYYRRR